MRNVLLLSLSIGLMAATAAHAQYGGGGGRGGGHGHGGGSSGPHAAAQKLTPVSDEDIVGVIQAIDAADGRITIAYDPVPVRNWPAGVMPFAVARPEILTGASVGEKVRFKLDSQQIVELNPYSGGGQPKP